MSFLLPGTQVRLPRLGYGCAPLMARTSRADSVRLLHTAVDAGLTHLDVARSYGYGEAESAVGDLLALRRSDVTVATKLGIAPPQRTTALRAAKALARRAASLSPRLRAALRARAARMVEGGRFGVEEARASLETSLGELRTDTVDILLLHDCRPEDLRDELLEFLRESVRAGRIRAFGIATFRDAAAEIVGSRPEFAPVVQVPDSPLDPPLAGLGPAVSTHSVLAGSHGRLRERLADDGAAAAWEKQLGMDPRNPDVLASLLLAAALRRNPEGIVLCSSRDPRHLAANARVACDGPPPEQIDAFMALLARDAELARGAA